MKVRGFQVAPAELEGHLLKHPAVSDTCVVGVPDEYSGEVPLAFVVLHSEVARKVEASAVEAKKVKEDIMKVCSSLRVLVLPGMPPSVPLWHRCERALTRIRSSRYIYYLVGRRS